MKRIGAVAALLSVLLGVTVMARPSVCRGYAWLDWTLAQHPRLRWAALTVRIFEPPLRKVGLLSPVRVEVERGVSLLLDPGDLIGSTILATGEWQPAVGQAIYSGLGDGAVFLDVGAHIGYFSLTAAVRVGRHGRVFAFEPDPDTLSFLRSNIAASRTGNVTVEPIACTDHEQELTLYRGPPDNTGASTLSFDVAKTWLDARAPTPVYRVHGRRIDDVVQEAALGRVDVIKIDVEGAEFDVLKGALQTLQRFHPKVIVEVNPPLLAAMHASANDVVSLLKEAGYTRSRQLDEMDWEYSAPRAVDPMP